jgi:hypothetical protein
MSTGIEQFVPDGKAKGCLPRSSRVGAVCPLFGERIKVIPEGEWKDYEGKITLEPYIPTILDQDGIGSCATESTTGGTMLVRAFAGLEFVLLNPWFIYHHTSGGRDQGSAIDDNLTFAREKGIASEMVWPRAKGYEATPSAEAYADALNYRIDEFYDIMTIQELVSALLLGFPVVYGSNGHSVLKVKHAGSTGLDLNSWGKGWGQGGLGVWAAYNQVNFQYGAFAIRTTTQIVSPDGTVSLAQGA